MNVFDLLDEIESFATWQLTQCEKGGQAFQTAVKILTGMSEDEIRGRQAGKVLALKEMLDKVYLIRERLRKCEQSELDGFQSSILKEVQSIAEQAEIKTNAL